MGEPLTPDEQYALRAELGKLLRIGRISRPGALYDTEISAQTSEASGHVILNPIDFDEACALNITKATENLKFDRIEGYGEFLANMSKVADVVNLYK